eukprot:1136346-Prymnesium_polylepis.1
MISLKSTVCGVCFGLCGAAVQCMYGVCPRALLTGSRQHGCWCAESRWSESRAGRVRLTVGAPRLCAQPSAMRYFAVRPMIRDVFAGGVHCSWSTWSTWSAVCSLSSPGPTASEGCHSATTDVG